MTKKVDSESGRVGVERSTQWPDYEHDEVLEMSVGRRPELSIELTEPDFLSPAGHG